jgi:hypothetical protein
MIHQNATRAANIMTKMVAEAAPQANLNLPPNASSEMSMISATDQAARTARLSLFY